MPLPNEAGDIPRSGAHDRSLVRDDNRGGHASHLQSKIDPCFLAEGELDTGSNGIFEARFGSLDFVAPHGQGQKFVTSRIVRGGAPNSSGFEILCGYVSQCHGCSGAIGDRPGDAAGRLGVSQRRESGHHKNKKPRQYEGRTRSLEMIKESAHRIR